MVIELSEKQLEKFNKWTSSFGELPYIGMTGGHFGVKIVFTSIGPLISGVAWNGEEINLTEQTEL